MLSWTRACVNTRTSTAQRLSSMPTVTTHLELTCDSNSSIDKYRNPLNKSVFCYIFFADYYTENFCVKKSRIAAKYRSNALHISISIRTQSDRHEF